MESMGIALTKRVLTRLRASLCRNNRYKYIENAPHHVTALKAFESLVSVNNEGGMGLTEVSEEVTKAGGKVVLATGDGYVLIDKRRTLCGVMAHNLCGVRIELVFPEEVWTHFYSSV